MAKQIDIPVIELSQLKRQTDEKDNRRPRLSDLRESGSIEQDSDIVIFIHNPTEQQKRGYNIHATDSELENIRELIVAKNRSGRTGDTYLLWEKQYMRFQTLDY